MSRFNKPSEGTKRTVKLTDFVGRFLDIKPSLGVIECRISGNPENSPGEEITPPDVLEMAVGHHWYRIEHKEDPEIWSNVILDLNQAHYYEGKSGKHTGTYKALKAENAGLRLSAYAWGAARIGHQVLPVVLKIGVVNLSDFWASQKTNNDGLIINPAAREEIVNIGKGKKTLHLAGFTPTAAPADLSSALDEVTPQFVAYIRQDHPDYLADIFPIEQA